MKISYPARIDTWHCVCILRALSVVGNHDAAETSGTGAGTCPGRTQENAQT
ncbi:MAG: hypothetical protein KHX53_10830 [Bacteroides sp.]|uniref:hypothetical protein n=1 Tax=Blautia hansenii TaxID=1322 RepID=UPI0022E7BF9B|nr:hypothetical protein [Blautia hansenii]MBS5552515.1 hypothetical protein [Bacteroides sp.]